MSSLIKILTKVLNFDRGHFSDLPLDKEIDVGEDDEGRSQRRPGVILNNQVVTLKLPVRLAVRLHFSESVAVWI